MRTSTRTSPRQRCFVSCACDASRRQDYRALREGREAHAPTRVRPRQTADHHAEAHRSTAARASTSRPPAARLIRRRQRASSESRCVSAAPVPSACRAWTPTSTPVTRSPCSPTGAFEITEWDLKMARPSWLGVWLGHGLESRAPAPPYAGGEAGRVTNSRFQIGTARRRRVARRSLRPNPARATLCTREGAGYVPIRRGGLRWAWICLR